MDDQFTLDSMTKRITIRYRTLLTKSWRSGQKPKTDQSPGKLAMSCRKQWMTRSSRAKSSQIHPIPLRGDREAVGSSLLLNSEIQIDGYVANASPAVHLMLY